MTSCVRFSAVLLFVFAIAFFATACGDGGGGDATSASYFVPPAPSPTEPVPDPTADPAVDPTPDPAPPDPAPAYENPFKGANVGDTVNFGRYPQTAAGDVQDIEWRVLSVEDDKVLAISRYGLDAKRFDDDSNKWENSEIRGWLNGEFYDGSFYDAEKGIIASSDPGKVFLLSKKEAEEYFDSNEDRKCWPTEYAKTNGASVNDNDDGCCDWWLRSPNPDDSQGVSIVEGYGCDEIYGGFLNGHCCVRPALWINLESE